MKKLLCLLFFVTLIIMVVSINQSIAKRVYNFWAYFEHNTEYMHRGVSRSDGETSLVGKFEYTYGMYTVDIAARVIPETVEWDLHTDFSFFAGPIDFNAGAHYYIYPDTGESAGVPNFKAPVYKGGLQEGEEKSQNNYDYEWDYAEFYLMMSHKFEFTPLQPEPGLNFHISPRYWKDEGVEYAVETELTLSLPSYYNLNLLGGYTDIEGDQQTGNGMGLDGGDGYDYFYWQVGIMNTWKCFDISLTYHNNNENDFRMINTDERIVFAIEFDY